MRHTWPDIPGVSIWRWPGGPIRIVDEPGPGFDAAAVDAEWSRLCAANPRYHDGPMLAVARAEPELVCRRTGYKMLAVQGAVETGTEQLSVTAVVMGKDAAGREHVLLGQRGESTRIYGGMWELGPSGGIEPPPAGVEWIDEGAVARQVEEEVREELGGAVRARVEGPVALAHDAMARSYDIVARCSALGPLGAGEGAAADNWEYRGSAWVPVDAVARFDAEHGERIIGPTRALFRFLGWIPQR